MARAAADVRKKLRGQPVLSQSVLAIAIGTLRESLKVPTTIDRVRAAAKEVPEILTALADYNPETHRFAEGVRRLVADKVTALADSVHPSHTTSRKLSRSERIAKSLPKMRNKIVELTKLDESNQPVLTKDPQELTAIASGFWKDKWAAAAPKLNLKTFLRAYKKRITTKKVKAINLEAVEAAILSSHNSCAGPDGISFAAYRAICHFASPVFLGAIRLMQKGVPPPKNFNAGTLFLIPKTGLPLVEDTRPIVVGNTFNRIIASALRNSIMDAAAEIIDSDQTAFIPGRRMTDNLREVNEDFYAALEGEVTHDLALFDFKKAFDSVIHETLFKFLQVAGFPRRTINMVKALYHLPHCHTAFAGAPPARIDFQRGIRQGCPVSPLLFILLLDMLASQLEKVGVGKKFFADDVAAQGDFTSRRVLPQMAKAFAMFGKATGLLLNAAKTNILTTRPLQERAGLRAALDSAGWNAFEIQEKATYLGLPIGPGADFGECFDNCIVKLSNRITQFSRLRRKLPMTSKILIHNVWLLPIVLYPCQFLAIPNPTGGHGHLRKIRQLCRGWLQRFKSFGDDDLCRPTELLGLKAPLAYVPLKNLALLASTAPNCTVGNRELYTMRFSTHSIVAAEQLCESTGLPWSSFAGKSPGEIYKLGIRSPSYMHTLKDAFVPRLRKVLIRSWGSTFAEPVEGQVGAHDHLSHLLTLWKALPSWVPESARFVTICIAQNALATAKRLKYIKDTHVHQDQDCPLCRESQDSGKHLFSECGVVNTAMANVREAWGLPIVVPSTVQRTFGLDLDNGTKFGIQVMINEAVWRLRTDILDRLLFEKRQGASPSSSGGLSQSVAVKLTELAMINILKVAPTLARSAELSGVSPNVPVRQPRKPDKSTPEGATSAREAVSAILRQLPGTEIQIWTDGSANPNPGPAGAGAVVVLPEQDHKSRMRAALGQASNNAAELWAIGMALEFALATFPGVPVNVFSDSNFAIGVLEKGHFCAKYHFMAHAIRKLVHTTGCAVRWHHVCSHVGIPLNEEADALAAEGAVFSSDSHMPRLNLAGAIAANGFQDLSF